MKDYTQGKIYKICSNNPDITEVYYGSTIQQLCSRMSSHRADYKRWNTGKSYMKSTIHYYFKQYGIEQFHIELVENYSCENKEQLLSHENKFIRGYECCNKFASFQTTEERKEYHKQYREDNKDKINESLKQYYQDNKEKIKEKTKQYSENNKEKTVEYQKQYREDNKEKLKEYFKERYQLNKKK